MTPEEEQALRQENEQLKEQLSNQACHWANVILQQGRDIHTRWKDHNAAQAAEIAQLKAKLDSLADAEATIASLTKDIASLTKERNAARTGCNAYAGAVDEHHEELRTLRQQHRETLVAALQACKDSDNERLREQDEARKEAVKWQTEGDGYGQNFHDGRAGGMNQAAIYFWRVQRLLEKAIDDLEGNRVKAAKPD